ncbi:hypothetical protein BJ170DRAFT_287342 [Xylariales sp. AK1849]|nr:hypothetical protein BJ170DRAFT_287342 [Xylariales sp. AK1849]
MGSPVKEDTELALKGWKQEKGRMGDRQAMELDFHRAKLKDEKDNIIRSYMIKIKNVTDPDVFTELEAAKNKEIDELETRYQREEVSGFYDHQQKRKASKLENVPKRPRTGSGFNLSTALQHLIPRQPADSQETQPQSERTITYDQVRLNAEVHGHWDTIIEYPADSQKWYALWCEEHQVHFRQSALNAAAKHLTGKEHGHPERSWPLSVTKFGYLITDCTAERQKSHNAKVGDAYQHGYQPVNKLAKFGRKADFHSPYRQSLPSDKKSFCKVTSNPGQASLNNQSPLQIESSGAVKPSLVENMSYERKTTLKREPSSIPLPSSTAIPERSQAAVGASGIITNPKAFRIYYGQYPDEDSGEMKYWPVMILGWDDQKPGNLPITLAQTRLFAEELRPPKCYTYKDGRITGWAPKYEDGGQNMRRREFPVMFFDENRSYSWMLASRLSKFPIHMKNAPRKKNHPRRAFDDARHFVAQREGYDTWDAREEARAKNGQARRKPLGFDSPSSHVSYREHRRSHQPAISAQNKDTSDSLESESEDEEYQKLQEKGGEISGDDDYCLNGSDDDDIGNEGDVDINDFWASAYHLRSEDRPKPSPEGPVTHHRCASGNSIPSGSAKSKTGPTGMVFTLRPLQGGCALSLNASGSHPVGPRESSTPSEIPKHTMGPPVPPPSSRVDEGNWSTYMVKLPASQDTSSSRQALEKGMKPPPLAEAMCSRASSTPATTSSFVPNPVASQLAKPKFTARRTTTSRQGVSLPAPSTTRTHTTTIVQSAAVSRSSVADPSKPLVSTTSPMPKSHNVPSARAASLPNTPNASFDMSKDPDKLSPAHNNGNGSSRPDIPSTNITAIKEVHSELSLYSNGTISWERDSPRGECLKLFKSADGKSLRTEGASVDISIDPSLCDKLVLSYIKEPSPNSLITLHTKEGHALKMVFDASPGSGLKPGRTQARDFVRWLQAQNPELIMTMAKPG